MNSLAWSQIITLLLAIAVFVILIVVLTRNTLDGDAGDVTKLDNKVNWLYGLAIAETGLMVLFGVIGFLFMMKWFASK
jgi:hypothetical protein